MAIRLEAMASVVFVQPFRERLVRLQGDQLLTLLGMIFGFSAVVFSIIFFAREFMTARARRRKYRRGGFIV